MRLSYRGVGYDYTPPSLEVTEGEILGKYRGQPWKGQIVQVTTPQPVRELKYRGVSYSAKNIESGNTTASQRAGISSVTTLSQSVRGAVTAATTTGMLCKARGEWLQVHHHNLRRNLERRLQVAKERGDQALVTQLENELSYIA